MVMLHTYADGYLLIDEDSNESILVQGDGNFPAVARALGARLPDEADDPTSSPTDHILQAAAWLAAHVNTPLPRPDLPAPYIWAYDPSMESYR